MQAIRSLLFLVFQMVTAVLFAILAILSFPFSFRIRYAIISRWAAVNLWCLKWVCGVTYEVIGRENIPETPCIIMCNHQSAWETLVLQVIFPPQAWVLKRELLWIPFFGWGLAALNPIAIDRKAGRQALNQIIKQGIARLTDGVWVVIFPEGTRMPRGKLGRFGIGGARLAAESGFPVLPVAHNAAKAWPKKGFIKHAGVIRISIGKPIAVENQTATSINTKTEIWIRRQMTILDSDITES